MVRYQTDLGSNYLVSISHILLGLRFLISKMQKTVPTSWCGYRYEIR